MLGPIFLIFINDLPDNIHSMVTFSLTTVFSIRVLDDLMTNNFYRMISIDWHVEKRHGS